MNKCRQTNLFMVTLILEFRKSFGKMFYTYVYICHVNVNYVAIFSNK